MVDISKKPYYEYNDTIDSLLQPIQQLADVRLNSMIRIFLNGERFLISHHKQEAMDYAEKELYRYGLYEKNRVKNHKNVTSGFQMWDFISKTPPEIFKYKLRNFQMAHGLTVIRQQGDYCDFFGFSSSPGNSQINNFYLDQKELFSQFVENFYTTLSVSLKELSQHTFRLPDDTKFFDQPFLTLSSRQQDCATLLAQGHSTKEIARLFHLSPRTVETHINILKEKLQAKNRTHLISILNK